MATQEVAIRQTVNITLKSDTEMLDDVVVVAYGTAKKSSFTGSATAVSGEKSRQKCRFLQFLKPWKVQQQVYK